MMFLLEKLGHRYFNFNEYKLLQDELFFIHLEGAFIRRFRVSTLRQALETGLDCLHTEQR